MVQKCWIEIIGIVVLIGIYCCTKWGADVEPPPPKPPKRPPTTNAPPTLPPMTNTVPKVQMTSMSVCQTNITGNGWRDTNGAFTCTFTNQVSFWIQSATDLRNWQDWVEVYFWQSEAGQLMSLSDGTNSVVSYCPEQVSFPSQPPGNFFRTVAK